jgi:hypothetical protein
MAGIAAILKALGRAVWRDLHSYHSLTGNNFFLFVLLLAQQLSATYFFTLILGLLLLFPLSADPLAKIPPDRLELWPLEKGERMTLRVGSMLMSPAAWITVAVVAKTSRPTLGLALLALAALVQALGVLTTRLAARMPVVHLLRWIPRPPGRWGGLVHKNLRQMLRVLDFYVALLLSASAVAYRIFGRNPDPEAFPMMAVIVVLALSTYAQCLFGIEWPEGWTRYRLMPVRGWQILLAKGMAFMLCAVVLVAGLNGPAGFAAALAALAVGHHASVYTPVPQQRWRFTGGTLWPTGLAQAVCMFGVGIGAHRAGVLYLGVAAAGYGVSLWFYGRAWDRARL